MSLSNIIVLTLGLWLGAFVFLCLGLGVIGLGQIMAQAAPGELTHYLLIGGGMLVCSLAGGI